ncbi:hypothetical protein [Streptomyces sp. NPDC058583]|uniref:hypothetical protein n=1 Tax=unclassified Streptomyces TaxID=2593676 RepID=UPI0036477F02
MEQSGHAADEREAELGTRVLADHDEAAPAAGVVRGDAVGDGGVEHRAGDAQAEAEADQARQDAGVRLRERLEQQHSHRGGQEARHQQGAGSDAGEQRDGDAQRTEEEETDRRRERREPLDSRAGDEQVVLTEDRHHDGEGQSGQEQGEGHSEGAAVRAWVRRQDRA